MKLLNSELENFTHFEVSREVRLTETISSIEISIFFSENSEVSLKFKKMEKFPKYRDVDKMKFPNPT